LSFDRKFRDRDEGDDSFDEPVDKSKDQVNVTLDAASRARVEEIKAAWDIKSDAKAIKLALEAGRNAIFQTFSKETCLKLSDRARVRASDKPKKEAAN
jgi:hypothetical protein